MPTRLRTLCRIAIATTLSVTVICGLTRLLRECQKARAEQEVRVRAAEEFLRAHPALSYLPDALQKQQYLPLEGDCVLPEHHHVDLRTAGCFTFEEDSFNFTDEGIELDEITSSQDANTRLHRLARKRTTTASKLYALLGMRQIKSKEYRSLLHHLERSRAHVKTPYGSEGYAVDRVADVARRIHAGRYDTPRILENDE